MLNKEFFYYNSIKNYIIAISHLVSDIHVVRSDSSGTEIKNIKVPLTYAGKTKLYYKLQQDQDRNISTILPRISFIFNSMERNSNRSTSYSNIINFTDDIGEEQSFFYNPIPFDFNFTISIWSKYIDDLHQMIEQIASFFDPDFSVTVHEIPVLNITKDISIVLRNIDVQTDNEFDDDDRVMTADLEVVLHGYIYKPISNSALIQHIKVNMIDDNTEAKEILETIEHTWNEITQEIDTTIT